MRIGIDARAVEQFPGIGRYAKNLVTSLATIDQNNEYYIFKHPAWHFPLEPQANIHTVNVNIPLVSLGSLLQFSPIVNRCDLDIYHSLCEILPLYGSYLRVITVHDIINLAFPWAFRHQNILKDYSLRLFFRTVGKRGVKKADHIIAVSQNTKNDLVNWTECDPEAISVVYEAVEKKFHKTAAEHLTEIQQRYQLPDRFLFYIGSFKHNKNINGLLKGFALYIAANPNATSLRLVLGGFKQFGLSRIMESIDALGLNTRIHLPGYIREDDLPAVYTLATALIYPSTYEGFGLPVLEAMACQTPVICSNTTSIPEVAGGAACYFNPFDPGDICLKISEVVNDPERCEQLSCRGLQQSKKFSWITCAEETLKVYYKLHTCHLKI